MTDDPTLQNNHNSSEEEQQANGGEDPASESNLLQDVESQKNGMIQDSQGATDSAGKNPSESEEQDALLHSSGGAGGGGDADADDGQEMVSSGGIRSSIQSDQDIKAREKNLKLAEAVAPPQPSMSSSITTTTTSSDREGREYSERTQPSSGRSSKTSDTTSKRVIAASSNNGASLTSSSSRGDRNTLRYSSNHHAAKHAKARQQATADEPGAIRVATTTNQQLPKSSSADNDDHDIEAVALIAEPVDDDDEDHIRKLRQDNEALRRQVELALQNERRALEEMQTMAQAPPANVSVVMGGDVATATSVVSAEEPPRPEAATRSPSNTAKAENCCWNLCKGTVFMAGCCCILCVVIVVVAIFAAGLDELIASATNNAGEETEAATRRSNLQTLLQPLEPTHEEAFNWLVDIDLWRPDLLNATTPPPSDQGVDIGDIGSFVGRITNSNGGSTVGTGERKWMFVERYYLAVLFFSTNGDDWKQNSGWLSETSSHCAEGAKKWFGIQCENDSIVSIELEANNLDGSFPKEILVLSNLRSVWMSGDGFDTTLTGTIPTMPGNLTQIWLWNMRLSGTLPEQLFELSRLTSLRLYENEFTGSVPNNIIQLSDLQTLELVGNDLAGTIPVLPNVTSCNLSSNKFADTTNGAAQGCLVFDQFP